MSVSQAQTAGRISKLAYVDEFALGGEDGINRLYSADRRIGMIDCFPSPCDDKERKKLESELIEPELFDIFETLKRIETQNEAFIIRSSNTDGNVLLAMDEKFDMTNEFIDFLNTEPRKPVASFKFDLPALKIGLIDTQKFYDKRIGIKALTEKMESRTEKHPMKT